MVITFIGGGNMATALIGGLRSTGHSYEIRVADPSESARVRLQEAHHTLGYDRAQDAVSGAEVIVLAVKPQVLPTVLDQLANHVNEDQCIVSVAAGITIARIRRTLGNTTPVVRTMPNTPALVGAGITGLYADDVCSETQRRAAESVMKAGGATVWLEEEDQINALTAISGSGPAYFYLFAELLAEAGTQLGLPGDTAALLASHTAHGAGIMTLEGGAELSELRRRVTSPGGTTHAAVTAFINGGLADLVSNATLAAAERSRELAAEGDES